MDKQNEELLTFLLLQEELDFYVLIDSDGNNAKHYFYACVTKYDKDDDEFYIDLNLQINTIVGFCSSGHLYNTTRRHTITKSVLLDMATTVYTKDEYDLLWEYEMNKIRCGVCN